MERSAMEAFHSKPRSSSQPPNSRMPDAAWLLFSEQLSGLLGTLSGGGSLGEAVEVFCENLEASAPD